VAGDFALLIALPLHAYALTGSAVATGGVFAAALLPQVLLGSIAGVFVDRWDRKRTMVAADLLRAGLLLPLLAVGSPDLLWLLYLVRAATGVAGLLFDPAESALLPRLVGEERLVTANALNALNNNLGRLVGPVMGGLLYAGGGLPAVVAVDVASFAVSAALIMAIRANARPERSDLPVDGTSTWGRAIGEWRAGVQHVGRDRALSAIFLAFGIGTIGEGTFAVGFTPLVIDVLDGGAAGAGVLASAQAIGGLLAGVLVARIALKHSPRVLFAGGLIGLGLADIGMANATAFAPPGTGAMIAASGFMLLAGFPVVAAFAAGHGLLQTLTADAYRGRVFGALRTIQGMATLVGLAIGGAAIDAVGVIPALSVGAAMWVVGGVLALIRLPRGVGDAQDGER
ncbi:MAG TPA: MFS transporter, partial [Acetobacteraceae bacterium]|nr:MFS transporter [Acetobacteraceae bacterium]